MSKGKVWFKVLSKIDFNLICTYFVFNFQKYKIIALVLCDLLIGVFLYYKLYGKTYIHISILGIFMETYSWSLSNGTTLETIQSRQYSSVLFINFYHKGPQILKNKYNQRDDIFFLHRIKIKKISYNSYKPEKHQFT